MSGNREGVLRKEGAIKEMSRIVKGQLLTELVKHQGEFMFTLPSHTTSAATNRIDAAAVACECLDFKGRSGREGICKQWEFDTKLEPPHGVRFPLPNWEEFDSLLRSFVEERKQVQCPHQLDPIPEWLTRDGDQIVDRICKSCRNGM